MTFKDQFLTDIDDVFFCFDEFSDTHTVNGDKFDIILDSDTLKERTYRDDIENVYTGDILFFCKKSDFGYMPSVGDRLNLDGEGYQIVNVDDNCGVLEITLKVNYGA